MMANFELKKDYTQELEAVISESNALAVERGLDVAVTLIFSLEKKCRLNNDFKNLKEICLHAVRICKDKKDWDKLNSVLAIINKRNAASKITISAVVTESITYVEETPSLHVKIELIKALKDVCEGKIYVEGESAKLHLMLSKIYEERGEIDAACDIVQDVHVETYGSLSKKEKAEYIVEQIRLTLLKKDYVRTLIHSRKMNVKFLDEIGFEEIKIKFFTMMVEYHTAVDANTWEISQAYYKIATTTVEGNTDKTFALESCILYLLLSKFDNHQSDMMQRLKLQLTNEFKTVKVNDAFVTSLNYFTTPEIIKQPFSNQAVLETHPSLSKFVKLNPSIEEHFVNDLKIKTIQHNIRVIAKYYKRIRLARFSELLNLTRDEIEDYLSDLSSEGDIHIKIDRPSGIVTFQQPKQPEEVLSEWSSDVSKMLNLMESTCHLINRENMVYKA